MKKIWTKEKIELLRKAYPDGNLASLAFRLGVTVMALRSAAKRLKLKRISTQGCEWTKQQEEYLDRNYADAPIETLVSETGHSMRSIHAKAVRMGLSRSKEYLRRMGIERLRNHPGAIANRFKKGNIPVTKGKGIRNYVSEEAYGRIKQSQFKKGREPYNSKPVGYESVRRDRRGVGYTYIKVEGKRLMVPKHRWLWEQAHGEIPEGYVVTFIDGNTSHCVLENLQLVSRKDHGRCRIAKESSEERRQRIEAAMVRRNETIRRDRIRLKFGMPQLSKVRLSTSDEKTRHRRSQLRGEMRQVGYIIEAGQNTVYYDEETQRSERLERRAGKLNFRLVSRMADSQDREEESHESEAKKVRVIHPVRKYDAW